MYARVCVCSVCMRLVIGAQVRDVRADGYACVYVRHFVSFHNLLVNMCVPVLCVCRAEECVETLQPEVADKLYRKALSMEPNNTQGGH